MLMSEVLKRCDPRPKVKSDKVEPELAVNLFSTVCGKYLRRDLRDEWAEHAEDLIYKLRQVARHRRGWSLIALLTATHGLLVMLLFRVWIDL